MTQLEAIDACGFSSDWLDNMGVMQALLQFGRASRHPAFPDVPTARELVEDARVRQIIELAEVPWELSRCFTAPPGVPVARVAVLRSAFAAALQYSALLVDAARLKLEIHPGKAEDIISQIELVSNASADILKRFKKIFGASRG